jgi:hypothetical protein
VTLSADACPSCDSTDIQQIGTFGPGTASYAAGEQAPVPATTVAKCLGCGAQLRRRAESQAGTLPWELADAH